MELRGVSPYYEADLPPLFEYHVIKWPDWNRGADGLYKIGVATIAFAIHKTSGPGSCGPVVTGNNNEYYDMWEGLNELPWVSFAILMAASTPAEHEYQKKALDKILEDTQGEIWPTGEKPIWKERDYINMVRGCFIPRLAFRTAGAFACPLQGAESIDHMALGLSMDDAFRKPYDEQGLLFNDGNNGMWGVPFEGSHWALFECGHMYSPTEADSWKAGAKMMDEGHKIGLNTPFSMGWRLEGNDRVKKEGPLYCNAQNWQIQIKKIFDPNTVSDPVGYISVD
jgi:hypothetical protein